MREGNREKVDLAWALKEGEKNAEQTGIPGGGKAGAKVWHYFYMRSIPTQVQNRGCTLAAN